MHPPALQRVIVNVGHGLNNASVGSYDSGATSCFGGPPERSIVEQVADNLLDIPKLPVALEIAPFCSAACEKTHKSYFDRKSGRRVSVGHLSWTIDWINENQKAGDYLLSLHMDAPDEEDPHPELPSGTSVYYSAGAPPQRKKEAELVAKTISEKLGLPNRGAHPDTHSHRKHLGILDETEIPALLIELGFIDNQADVDAALNCGDEAIAAAIDALHDLRKEK